MKIKDLNHNPMNPRQITDEELALLEGSLQKFGPLDGFIYNRRFDRLEGGHQRTKVLPPEAEIQLTQTFDPPTAKGTVAYGVVEIEGEYHPFREVDWDEETALAANIAANQGGGSFHIPRLTEILIKLDGANFPLKYTCFTPTKIENLMAPVAPVEPLEEKELTDIFEVVVVCKSESEQRAAFERLTSEGYECRVLSM